MPQEDWLKLLHECCQIDSRTDEPSQGSTRVSQLLASRLEALGFALSWFTPAASEGTRGQHLIATRNTTASRRLLLLGHTDTVLGPADVPIRVDDATGRLLGAGVCDMKGGDVMMLAALTRALSREQAVRDAAITVLLSCSEEDDGPSFRTIARQNASGSIACLCFEPARLGKNGEQHFVTSRKGVVRFKLTIRGRAAHSGNAHPVGVNANRELARKVEALESLTNPETDVTVNVGVITGGRATNQVSDLASASFEVRAFDPAILRAACDRARAICSTSTISSPTDGRSTQLALEEYEAFPAWPTNAWTDALAQRYMKLASQRSLNVQPVASGGGSDASHVADLIPAIDGLGILGGAMHSSDEWADVRSFESRTLAAADLIEELCVHG
jgi:glutamate carboxypeptidase